MIAAPSTDHELARRALHSLETQTATAIGDGITAPAEGGDPPLAILLPSDGASTTGRDPLDAADEARERGVPIYTVALGTDAGQVTITDENGFSRTIPEKRPGAVSLEGRPFAAVAGSAGRPGYAADPGRDTSAHGWPLHRLRGTLARPARRGGPFLLRSSSCCN